MDPAKASATAAGVAVARGAHRSCDQPPWVLDDPFALQLAGPRWAEIQSASEAAFPETALRQSRAGLLRLAPGRPHRLAAALRGRPPGQPGLETGQDRRTRSPRPGRARLRPGRLRNHAAVWPSSPGR